MKSPKDTPSEYDTKTDTLQEQLDLKIADCITRGDGVGLKMYIAAHYTHNTLIEKAECKARRSEAGLFKINIIPEQMTPDEINKLINDRITELTDKGVDND